MSKVATFLSTITIVYLFVYCHANGVPEVEVKGSSYSQTVRCVKKKQYYVNGTCERCARPRDCPDGQIMNKTYPIQMGDHGAENCRPCVPCPAGRYKNRRTQGQCVWETDCLDIGRGFIVHTDGTQDSECSSECRQGWFQGELECAECTAANINRQECKGLFTAETLSADVKRSSEPEEIPGGYGNPHHLQFEYWMLAPGIILFGCVMIAVLYVYKRCTDQRHQFICIPTTQSSSSVRSDRGLIPPGSDQDVVTDSAPDSDQIRLQTMVYDGDLEQSKIEVVNELKMKTSDYLKRSEETWCKKKKLIEAGHGDPYLLVVSKKANRPMEPLFQELGLEENDIFHNRVDFAGDNVEFIYQCLSVWLKKSGNGRTVYDLYHALKKTKYNTVLKNNIIKMIRENMKNKS